MSADIDLRMVARAAFAVASIGRRDPTDADIEVWARMFGARHVAIALRTSAELALEEAAALETFGAIRVAKGQLR
jgi:2-methylaconitate cis-trans-isomerase PrpF